MPIRLRVLGALGALGVGMLAAPAMAGAAVNASRLAAVTGRLVSQSPAAGASLQTAPARIRLVFSRPVQPADTQITVGGPQGSVTVGRPHLAGRTLTQALRPGLSAATYVLTWRVRLADGSSLQGTSSFSVTGATRSGSATGPSASPSGAATTGRVAQKAGTREQPRGTAIDTGGVGAAGPGTGSQIAGAGSAASSSLAPAPGLATPAVHSASQPSLTSTVEDVGGPILLVLAALAGLALVSSRRRRPAHGPTAWMLRDAVPPDALLGHPAAEQPPLGWSLPERAQQGWNVAGQALAPTPVPRIAGEEQPAGPVDWPEVKVSPGPIRQPEQRPRDTRPVSVVRGLPVQEITADPGTRPVVEARLRADPLPVGDPRPVADGRPVGQARMLSGAAPAIEPVSLFTPMPVVTARPPAAPSVDDLPPVSAAARQDPDQERVRTGEDAEPAQHAVETLASWLNRNDGRTG